MEQIRTKNSIFIKKKDIMNTIDLKSNLYNLIEKTKDIDILQAINILLEKQFKSNEEVEFYDELQIDYELTEEHKKKLDER